MTMTPDINIILLDFKEHKGKEMVVLNEDDSYTIFINSRLSAEGQKQACEHAIRHITGDDFQKENVQAIEAAAHEAPAVLNETTSPTVSDETASPTVSDETVSSAASDETASPMASDETASLAASDDMGPTACSLPTVQKRQRKRKRIRNKWEPYNKGRMEFYDQYGIDDPRPGLYTEQLENYMVLYND